VEEGEIEENAKQVKAPSQANFSSAANGMHKMSSSLFNLNINNNFFIYICSTET